MTAPPTKPTPPKAGRNAGPVDIKYALGQLAAAIETVESKLADQVDDTAARTDGDAAIRRQAATARRCADDAATRLDAAVKDLQALVHAARLTKSE